VIRFTKKLGLVVLLSGAASYAVPASKSQVINQWTITRATTKGYSMPPQERSRPVIVGDIVYYGNLDGTVAAVHRTKGYKFWEVKLPSGAGIDGAFSYGRSRIYAGDTKGNLYALNARDGSIAWKFSTHSEWLSPPAVARDRVIAATGNDEIFALSEKDGKEKWHYSRRGDEKMTVRGAPAPFIHGGEVYQGFSDGHLVGLSVNDGKVLWAQKLRSRDRFYDIDMSPQVDDQHVIAATYDGNLYALDRASGNSLWVFRVGSYGGFLVEGDKVYFSGLNGNLYCLNKGTGSVIWQTAIGTGVGLTPARAGDYLVVTTSSDPFYVVDPASGKVISEGRLGAGTLAAPTGHLEGWFYTLSNFGNLYAFEILKNVYSVAGIDDVLRVPSAFNRFASTKPHIQTP